MDKNILYEKVIEDLINNNYAQVDGFFTESTCIGLKNLLMAKEQDGVFKKANIGNRINAKEVLAIRSDKISWIENDSENLSIPRLMNFVLTSIALAIQELKIGNFIIRFSKKEHFTKDISIDLKMTTAENILLSLISIKIDK
ncbi:MAG: hypothetical protein AB8F94_08690 [Saprospiraceae bacterium]